jgi:hypothetical protein
LVSAAKLASQVLVKTVGASLVLIGAILMVLGLVGTGLNPVPGDLTIAGPNFSFNAGLAIFIVGAVTWLANRFRD